MNIESIMKYTCDLAINGIDMGSGPFASVIVDENGSIVGEGNNMVTMQNDPTQHAEMVALRNACQKLNTFSLRGYTLFTSCEPCPMCLSAIYWARISNVYYGNNRDDAKEIGFDDSNIYDEISLDIDKRSIKMTQLCRDSAILSFQKWAEKSDKTPY